MHLSAGADAALTAGSSPAMTAKDDGAVAKRPIKSQRYKFFFPKCEICATVFLRSNPRQPAPPKAKESRARG